MGAGKTWRRRFGCALALVLAPLVALALGQPMVEAASPGTPGKLEADVGLRATREAPGWFVEEVVDVDGREERWWPAAKKEYGRESRKEGGAHGSHSAAFG